MAEQTLLRTMVIVVASALGVVVGLVLHLEVVVLGLVVVAAVAIVLVTIRLALGHMLLTRRLRRAAVPMQLVDTTVQVIPNVAPMVAGLVRPTVFCGDSVASLLEPPQQRAVLLHERGHQLVRDPIRLVGIEAVERSLGFLPMVRRVTTRARARLEIQADRYALDHGVSRRDLARALIQLSDLPPATAAGFAEVTEERIRALAGNSHPAPREHGWTRVILVVVLVATLVATMAATDHPELGWFSECVATTCGVDR